MKDFKRLAGLFLALALVLTGVFSTSPMPIKAATSNVIALSAKKTSVKVGYSKTITLQKNGKKVSKGVTWSTNKKSVATVKNGKITGKKKGTAKITAKYQKKKYTCTVTVTKTDVIELSSTKVSLVAGKTQTIYLYKNGKKVSSGVMWASNKTSCATVARGKIKAVAKGTAKITAKYKGKAYTCTVTVSAAAAPVVVVPTVKLSATSVTLNPNQIYKLNLYDGSKDVTRAATWTSSDSSIVSTFGIADSGMRAGTKEGTATVTATYNKKTYTCTVTVKYPETDIVIEPASMTIRASFLEDVKLTEDGADVTAQAEWSVDDDAVVSVKNAKAGKIEGLSEGEAVVKATYTSPKSKKKVEKTVSVKVNPKYTMKETGFDGTDEACMKTSSGSKLTLVDFTCTDQDVLDKYLKENQDAKDQDLPEPYDIGGDTVPTRIAYETDCETKTYTFYKLPGTMDELKTIPLVSEFDPMACNIVAMAMCDATEYSENSYEDWPIFELLDYINGPTKEISKIDKSDCLSSGMLDTMIRGKYCYFEGATPKNKYKADEPLTFTLTMSPYYMEAYEGVNSYPERYMILISFGGDDSQRYCDVYYSPSQEKWFSWHRSYMNLFGSIKPNATEW